MAENPATIHDFWATFLDILGLDHQKLTWYHNGNNRRITGVHGHVIGEVPARGSASASTNCPYLAPAGTRDEDNLVSSGMLAPAPYAVAVISVSRAESLLQVALFAPDDRDVQHQQDHR